ncbi:MAG: SWIM zinc finger family protein [Candidatus Thorarchaeota archaeon]
MDNRKLKRKGPKVPQRKTEYEKQRTHEEVEQIKRDLVNFAQTSWGTEWIRSNLKIGRPFRMQRGIEYVKDQRRIDNLSINPGQIFATVQGTAPTPYRVKINFEIIPKEGWELILTNLKDKPIYLIELLEGKLPEDLIKIFDNTEYSLFPDASKGLNATCSCPDKAIPCKHIAAVILYLARVIDYNPFLLLELRGKTKSEIFSNLRFRESEESQKISEKDSDLRKYDFKFNIPQIYIQDLSTEKKSTGLDEYPIQFKLRKPGNIIETLENLGIPPIIDNKAFEIVLRAIYQKITSETYRLSIELKD